MKPVIQSLWIGPELSVMEQLSIVSFLRNGHPFHLYVYDEVGNVPEGAVVKDAGEILPASAIFQYRETPSYAGFSDFFRYRLLLERGGYWADTDFVCLKPFDFETEYVFSAEPINNQPVVTSGIIRAPKNSEIMACAWETCKMKDPAKLAWGEVGPRLMGQLIERLSLGEYVQPYPVFCPLGYYQWRAVLKPQLSWNFDDSVRAVHMWNEMWRRIGYDKDISYHHSCLYERLKSQYFGQTEDPTATVTFE